ncbi:MAG: prepilin-type N-terminal cleavage/methylation domain-containing protein [Phycisphaeraceae bacterium]|nr:prepilin-type N-terminal cleavage/methylation domain-containing protein [Phycisphaeraceae bacterium]
MRDRRHHRGLTLIELMMALSITALVAGAIAGMLSAVTAGTSTRRDVRSQSLLGHAIWSRLSAYVETGRALVHAADDRCVVWLHDDTPGGTMHASELRWIERSDDGVLTLSFVRFPDGWSEVDRAVHDRTIPRGADVWTILGQYRTLGWTASIPVGEEVGSLQFELDDPDPFRATHIVAYIEIEGRQRPLVTAAPLTIWNHREPTE